MNAAQSELFFDMTYCEQFAEKPEACREIYLKHGGKNHELIEKEMYPGL